MTAIDPRLRDAGLAITGGLLLDLWADHTPAHLPVPESCPGCGHTYTTTTPLCPTAAVIRPLLRHRRHEIGLTVIEQRLTYNQQQDLLGERLSTTTTTKHYGPKRAMPVTPDLFEVTSYRHITTTKGADR